MCDDSSIKTPTRNFPGYLTGDASALDRSSIAHLDEVFGRV